MRKHGYYERYYISIGFNQKIPIRRFICKVCGRTISVMPIFVLPKFQYSLPVIMKYLLAVLTRKSTITECIDALNSENPDLPIYRQHVYFYRKRIRSNIPHIELGLRQINPALNLPESNDVTEKLIGLITLIQETFDDWDTFSFEFTRHTCSNIMSFLKIEQETVQLGGD